MLAPPLLPLLLLCGASSDDARRVVAHGTSAMAVTGLLHDGTAAA
jgi:hypothetical protein